MRQILTKKTVMHLNAARVVFCIELQRAGEPCLEFRRIGSWNAQLRSDQFSQMRLESTLSRNSWVFYSLPALFLKSRTLPQFPNRSD